MKHFVDIERLREEDVQIGDSIRPRNDMNFHIGDPIVIQHKIDGSNGSFHWEDGEVKAFSRKNELTPEKSNQGFFEFVNRFPNELNNIIKDNANLVFFGEWEVKHTIVYRPEVYRKFYLYDIYNTDTESYMPQTVVQKYAETFNKLNPNIEYIATYYSGPFQGWGHVRMFLHENTYGDKQEGVVVKNQLLLGKDYVESSSAPTYIKIVNDEFKETQLNNHIKKVTDPNDDAAKQHAMDVMSQIVTYPRVLKLIKKATDEDLLPLMITPRDMGTAIKVIVPEVYKDCVKEEKPIVDDAGEYAGKACSKLTINLLRKIIVGD